MFWRDQAPTAAALVGKFSFGKYIIRKPLGSAITNRTFRLPDQQRESGVEERRGLYASEHILLAKTIVSSCCVRMYSLYASLDHPPIRFRISLVAPNWKRRVAPPMRAECVPYLACCAFEYPATANVVRTKRRTVSLAKCFPFLAWKRGIFARRTAALPSVMPSRFANNCRSRYPGEPGSTGRIRGRSLDLRPCLSALLMLS